MIRMAAAVLLGVIAYPAAADEPPIPIRIHWQIKQPDDISIVDRNGTSRLDYDAASKTFRGTIDRPEVLSEARTVLVRFGTDSFPLILNVRSNAPRVEFTVARDNPRSCAELFVRRVERPTDNSTDAMRLMLTAAYMLTILPSNECTDGRLPRTTKALLERNTNLASASLGLFAINPDWKQKMLQLSPDQVPGNLTAETLVATSDATAQSALAGQLYKGMTSSGNAATSLAIGTALVAKRDGDPAFAKALDDQRVGARLDADVEHFQTIVDASKN